MQLMVRPGFPSHLQLQADSSSECLILGVDWTGRCYQH